jgi:hypothetical protein
VAKRVTYLLNLSLELAMTHEPVEAF